MTRLLMVGLGGAVGSAARYLLSVWMLRALGPEFPYGTLTVNLVGSFALAVLMQLAKVNDAVPAHVWLALTTGLLGGFTTYSTFNFETFRYLQDGAWVLASVYALVTVVGSLLACALGLAAGRAAFGG